MSLPGGRRSAIRPFSINPDGVRVGRPESPTSVLVLFVFQGTSSTGIPSEQNVAVFGTARYQQPRSTLKTECGCVRYCKVTTAMAPDDYASDSNICVFDEGYDCKERSVDRGHQHLDTVSQCASLPDPCHGQKGDAALKECYLQLAPLCHRRERVLH